MFGQKDANNAAVPQAPSAPVVPQNYNPSSVITPASALDMPQPVVPPMPPMNAFGASTPAQVPYTPASDTTPSVTPSSTSTSSTTTTEDLAVMKQEALKHLQPLVSSLQQSPEEEFRTVMMMIQATDDKSMLKKALDAAKAIKDDKIRAQAMLDVINEINYFAQTSQDQD